jgi:hypothetical protein
MLCTTRDIAAPIMLFQLDKRKVVVNEEAKLSEQNLSTMFWCEELAGRHTMSKSSSYTLVICTCFHYHHMQ